MSDWPTWALQGLIVLGIGRVWLAIDKNTESLAQLREEIPKSYATKTEVQREIDSAAAGFKGARSHLDELRDKVWRLEGRVTAIDGSVKDAREHLP